MRVLVACEFSGRVRDAFIAKGHDAWSCDLEPTEVEGPHYKCDVRDIIGNGWDLMIAHPPCTYLAVSGAHLFKYRQKEQQEAIDFFMLLAKAKIHKKCIENPVCIMSTRWRKPNQIVEPYEFGDPWTKRTCLWLKNLPLLRPTNIVNGTYSLLREPPSPERQKNRSRTFLGIAKAMAEQWG